MGRKQGPAEHALHVLHAKSPHPLTLHHRCAPMPDADAAPAFMRQARPRPGPGPHPGAPGLPPHRTPPLAGLAAAAGRPPECSSTPPHAPGRPAARRVTSMHMTSVIGQHPTCSGQRARPTSGQAQEAAELRAGAEASAASLKPLANQPRGLAGTRASGQDRHTSTGKCQSSRPSPEGEPRQASGTFHPDAEQEAGAALNPPTALPPPRAAAHLDAQRAAAPLQPPLERGEGQRGAGHQARLLQEHAVAAQGHGVQEGRRLALGAPQPVLPVLAHAGLLPAGGKGRGDGSAPEEGWLRHERMHRVLWCCCSRRCQS